MSYILENKAEFDRLERQSRLPQYDFKKELQTFNPKQKSKILDAGCGSGLVTRYLGEKFHGSSIIGCDLSSARMDQAKELSHSLNRSRDQNPIQFQVEDLKHLSFSDGQFDAIVCRYVLEHLSSPERVNAISEFMRCLRPGGQLFLIDMDGLFLNLQPCSPLVDRILNQLEHHPHVDLQVGRKLPPLLASHGFKDVKWSIETLQFRDEWLETEIEMIQARMTQTREEFAKLAGSEDLGLQFEKEYIEALRSPGAVLFYNKFLVSAVKPQGESRLKSLLNGKNY